MRARLGSTGVMTIRTLLFLLALVLLVVGCANRPVPEVADRVTIFVPGVAGDGAWYDALHRELAAADRPARTFTWGAPKAFFFNNFTDEATHDRAEAELAEMIEHLPDTVKRIDLIGHSAGCGVILGGVSKSRREVDTIVLLAPSVSPGYDLAPASRQTRGAIHSFHSEYDVTLLKWRASTFGTYDRVKTPAAGHAGFAATDAKLVQHAYDPTWDAAGNDGSHFGPVSGTFVRQIVLPLLRGDLARQRDDAR